MQEGFPIDARLVVLMGVAGSGKTAVGRRLAERLGWTFVDADDLHAPEAVARMARGEPLTDRDREPWLRAIGERLDELERRGERAVLACSALRSAFRARLLAGRDGRLVHLEVPRDVLATRLGERAHFFPPGLLASQLAALERPADALAIDATAPADEVAARIARELAGTGGPEPGTAGGAAG